MVIFVELLNPQINIVSITKLIGRKGNSVILLSQMELHFDGKKNNPLTVFLYFLCIFPLPSSLLSIKSYLSYASYSVFYP